MTDRVEDQLTEAGQLLRGWRDEQEALGRTAAGDDALPLSPTLPGSDRRWMLGAAAALILLAGALGAVAWNRRDDSVPVATAPAPATVALVPSSLDGWDAISILDPADSEPLEQETNLIIVARPDTGPADGQSVRLTAFDAEGSTPPNPPGEPVDVRGRDGWLAETAFGGGQVLHVLRVLPPAGRTTVLMATSGPEVSKTDLIELTGSFDPDRPLAEQPIPDGWALEVDGRELIHLETRGVYLDRTDRAPSSAGHNVSVVSVTGISPEHVLWYMTSPFTETVEIRGVQGVLSSDPGNEFSFGSLSWVEDPGMAVSITFSSDDPGVDAVAALRAVAEDLVAVDAAGWDEFASQATGPAGDSGGSGEELTTDTTLLPPGDAPATAVPLDEPEPLLPEFSDLPEGPNGLGFALPGGQVVQVYAVESTGQLCWGLADDENPRCDPGGALAIDGAQAIQPRLASSDDGSIQFVYGFLPPDATTASVTATGEGSSYGTAVMIGGRVWAAPFALADGATQVEVEYLDEDGNVVAEASIG